MSALTFTDLTHRLDIRLTAELYPDIVAKTGKAFGDIIPLSDGVQP